MGPAWLPTGTGDHPNHTSALAHRMVLGRQLSEAAAAGMIDWCHPEWRHRRLSATSCLWELLRSPGARSGCWGLITRVPGGLGSPSVNDCMGMRHPVTERIGRWVVLPQGTSQSPAVFCEVTRALCRIFNRQFQEAGLSVEADVFVDDFVCVGDTHADMQAAFRIMDAAADPDSGLGIVWNLDKVVGRDSPVTRMEALGLIIDAPSLTLHLPDSKRDRYLADLREFKARYSSLPTCPRKPLARPLARPLLLGGSPRRQIPHLDGRQPTAGPGGPRHRGVPR